MSEADTYRCLPIADTEWAYLAGIIDGEGCISLIMGSNGYPHPRIQIANKKMELHDWLSFKFGFKTLAHNNKSKCYTTHCAECSHIQEILEGILPYTVLKTEQANLLLEYVRNTKGQGKKNLTEPKRIEEIVIRLKKLHYRERRSE